MNATEAVQLAKDEYERFKILFMEELAKNPDLEYSEVADRVVYEHPSFDNEADEALYDAAAYLVAFRDLI